MSEQLAIADAQRAIARAITAGVIAGGDATGGYVASLTEAVMGVTQALVNHAEAVDRVGASVDRVAEAIEHVAEALVIAAGRSD